MDDRDDPRRAVEHEAFERVTDCVGRKVVLEHSSELPVASEYCDSKEANTMNRNVTALYPTYSCHHAATVAAS